MLVLLATFAWLAPASAQAPGATPKRAQAERNAVDLKQGMTIDEVQKLLGKPQRTTLRTNGSASSISGQGSLQWTYVWTSASTQGTLQVEFAAKAPEASYVDSWEWRNY